MDWTLIASLAGAALGLTALVAALAALNLARRALARQESLESGLAGLSRELEHLASISVRTGRRVQRVEQEFSGVAERVDEVEARGVATAGRPELEQAIDQARRGAEPATLAKTFGLSSGEADLLARLHGQKKRTGG
jgi:phage shock protein A